MSDLPLPRRVALLLHAPAHGGAQRRTLSLACALARREVAVDVVVVRPDGELAGSVPEGVVLSPLPPGLHRLARLAGGRRLECAAAVPALARWLWRERPDVLMAAANHVHLPAILASRLLPPSVPTALVLRASNHLTGGGRGRPLADWLKRRSLALYGLADAVAAVSADLAAQLPGTRVAELPNPVVDDSFPERMTAPSPHPWLNQGRHPVVLAVGRMEEQKDFPTLLRAMARLRTQRPARLILLGDGSQRSHLEAMVRALDLAGSVAMPGFVADALPWMRRAALVVSSSAWEGMPGVLIEAMACGRPVVATNCPGGAAELLRQGRLGPLVPVGDDAALAVAMAGQLDCPTPAAALIARAGDFTVDAAAGAYLELFGRAMLRRRAGR